MIVGGWGLGGGGAEGSRTKIHTQGANAGWYKGQNDACREAKDKEEGVELELSKVGPRTMKRPAL